MRVTLSFAIVGIAVALAKPCHVQAQVFLMAEEGSLVQCANAPMSARLEITKVFANGTITDHDAALVARDSKGRVFWQWILSKGEVAVGHSPGWVSVSDPISGESFQLQPEKKTASIVSSTPIPVEKIAACGDYRLGPPGQAGDIGTSVIEGVTVKGRRTTFPQGGAENPESKVLTMERWFSEELDLSLEGQDDNQLLGIRKSFRYIDVERGEPDESLFRIPDGFAITAREQIQVTR